MSKLKSNEYMLSDGCGGVLCLWLPPPLYIYIYIYMSRPEENFILDRASSATPDMSQDWSLA